MVCKLLSHGGEILIPDRLLEDGFDPEKKSQRWITLLRTWLSSGAVHGSSVNVLMVGRSRAVSRSLSPNPLKGKPTIITTNLGYDEWANFLGNRPMVEALLSRLRHYRHTVRIKGPSLRDPQG